MAPHSAEVPPGSVEVAPGLTEDVAPSSEEDARPNLSLNSVAVSAGDLLSTVCWWSMTGLVEDLLVGVEEIWGGWDGRVGRSCKGGGGGREGRCCKGGGGGKGAWGQGCRGVGEGKGGGGRRGG